MTKLANYFDYAAATPLLPQVQAAMLPYLKVAFHNPSALYLASRNNRLALEAARSVIAKGLGSKPTEIIFTAGGTEANNLAIRGIMEAYPKAKCLVSAIEHDSVLAPAKLYKHRLLLVDKRGFVNVDNLPKIIDDKTVLVSIMYANNEVGTIQPLRQISQIIKEIRKDRINRGVKLPLYFHSDACQAANYLDMQVDKLGVDLLTINAGKIYGPKQCGALFVARGTNLQPQILGGGQERGLRSGTQNLANIVGFAKAWAIVRQDYRKEARRLEVLRDEFINNCVEQIPNTTIHGPLNEGRLANNINLAIKSVDNEWLVMSLDEAGFEVATGSACSASNNEPSHVFSSYGC